MSQDETVTTAYHDANEKFAETIAQDLEDGDLVWIQDYHLMLLPKLLREEAERKNISIRIGFFLHTPFPTTCIYTALPSEEDILKGVLASDMIGFHTDEYRFHFQEACAEIL